MQTLPFDLTDIHKKNPNVDNKNLVVKVDLLALFPVTEMFISQIMQPQSYNI